MAVSLSGQYEIHLLRFVDLAELVRCIVFIYCFKYELNTFIRNKIAIFVLLQIQVYLQQF